MSDFRKIRVKKELPKEVPAPTTEPMVVGVDPAAGPDVTVRLDSAAFTQAAARAGVSLREAAASFSGIGEALRRIPPLTERFASGGMVRNSDLGDAVAMSFSELTRNREPEYVFDGARYSFAIESFYDIRTLSHEIVLRIYKNGRPTYNVSARLTRERIDFETRSGTVTAQEATAGAVRDAVDDLCRGLSQYMAEEMMRSLVGSSSTRQMMEEIMRNGRRGF